MKAIKYFFTGILGLIVIAVLAVVITVNVIDPKRIKDQLASQVKKLTGRDLTIAGDIHWTLFPWLKVQLNQAQLSNRSGFDKPFLQAETLDVSIKLLPLLSKQIEISQIALDKVQVNAEVDPQGVNNWSDMQKPSSTKPATTPTVNPTATSSAMIQELHINEIALTHAQLNYEDRSKQQSFSLNDLNYHGNLDIANLSGKNLLENIRSSSHFEAESLKFNKMTLQKIKMDLALDQGSLTINPVSLTYNGGTLNSKILLQPTGETYSLSAENIDITQPHFLYRDAAKGTRIKAENFKYSGSVNIPNIKAPNIQDQIRISGKLSADQLSVNNYTVDKLKTAVEGGQGKIRLAPFSLAYNGGMISTNLTITTNGQTAAIDAENIDISQPHFLYRDAAKGTRIKAENFKYTGNVHIPNIKAPNIQDQVRISGKLSADQLGVNDYTVEKLKTAVEGGQGKIRLAPFSLAYNGGTLSSNFTLTSRGKIASLEADNLALTQPHFSYRHPTKGTQIELQNLNYQGNVNIANLTSKSLLSEIRSNGQLKISAFSVNKVAVQALSSHVQTEGGRIHASTTANFYSGSINSDVTLQQVGNSFSLRDNDSIKNVDAAALLTAMGSTDPVSGRLSFSFQGGSANLSALPQNLNGRGQIQLANGRIKKLELVTSINRALSFLRLGESLHVGREGDTPFSNLSGTYAIQNGVISNNDLLLDSPTLKITGKGSINLNNKQIDYDVLADVTALTIGKNSDDQMFKLGGGIPLKISGTTNDPKVRPRLDLMAKNVTKSLVKEAGNNIKKIIDAPSTKEAIKNILNF